MPELEHVRALTKRLTKHNDCQMSSSILSWDTSRIERLLKDLNLHPSLQRGVRFHTEKDEQIPLDKKQGKDMYQHCCEGCDLGSSLYSGLNCIEVHCIRSAFGCVRVYVQVWVLWYTPQTVCVCTYTCLGP